MYKLYEQYLSALNASAKYRRLGVPRQAKNADYLDFSTNDYLNLSHHSHLIAAAQLNTQLYGVGSTGSRLLSGNLELYEKFEHRIATDKQSEAGLIFSSGFQANLSTLSCLLNPKILKAQPLVFFDKLNHASLYQAIFLSKAKLYRYHHNDLHHLEKLLTQHQSRGNPKFIVTETVFGMDGDFADLNQIVQLANQYQAFLYLDEAHATGVFGTKGYGLSTTVDLQRVPHLIMGTFSKALGTSGGYVAGSKIIQDLLINQASGLIYSTAPSPGVVGAAYQAWQLIEHCDQERQHLQKLGDKLRIMLTAQGFDIGTSQTHIVPIILRDEAKCLNIQKALLAKKILVSAIRPPTVPPNSARLRIALTAHHQMQDLERLVTTLTQIQNP